MIFVISLTAQTITYKESADATSRPPKYFKTYISKDDYTFSIGDTITIGPPSGQNDNYLFLSRTTIFGDPLPMITGLANTKLIVKKIKFGGTRKLGYSAWLQFEGTGDMSIFWAWLENSLEAGEIDIKGYTSNEALEELKEAKTKLDLELITRLEYDSLKAVLAPYIK